MQSVLVVEDDQRIASGYLLALQNVDAAVLLAGSASEALAAVTACQHIKVVIVDYRLPDGDGLSLIQDIRDICKREWLQFIVATGHATVSMAQRAIDLGVHRLLTKPIKGETLADLATSALIAADRLEREITSNKIVTSTITEVERKLGALSRVMRPTYPNVVENANYRDLLRTELDRELARKARIEKTSISEREWLFLLQVALAEFHEQPITLKGAAYLLNMPLSSVIRKANSLCERGILERSDDPSDARRSFLKLAPRAHEIVKRIMSGNPELMASEQPCTD